MRPPIPSRLAPLIWRRPAIVWTPLALVAAIAGPALLFRDNLAAQRLAIASGFAVFALALTILGLAWLLRRPPRTRRAVVLCVLTAGAVVALAAPIALAGLVGAAFDPHHTGAREAFGLSMSLTLAPLALLLGLPLTLVSAVLFSWLALDKRAVGDSEDVLGDGAFGIEPFP